MWEPSVIVKSCGWVGGVVVMAHEILVAITDRDKRGYVSNRVPRWLLRLIQVTAGEDPEPHRNS